jgi:hypothetical protein
MYQGAIVTAEPNVIEIENLAPRLAAVREAQRLWQKYSNEAPEVLTTTAERLKEYF